METRSNRPTASEALPDWEDLVDRSPVKAAPAPSPQAAPLPAAQAVEPAIPELSRDEKDRRMAAYMTHELRAPLTSIRSALGILQMQMAARLDPEEAQILQMAVRNADRLGGLINDIMDFSKLRAGKMELHLEPLDPQDLLQEAVDSLRSWAVSRGIRLARVESDEPVPRVLADRRRVVQVLTNLLSNAIKFTPAGGKVAVAAAAGKFEHAGTVEFRVKDSGPGIPAKDLERIFRSFEQSAVGAKSGSGTGLGLTLAKAMVERLGGRIWAESWRGLGATFKFTLPIFTGEAKPRSTYPKPVEYHGLFVRLASRMNAVVAALFA